MGSPQAATESSCLMSRPLWEYQSVIVETKGFLSRGQLDAASTDEWLNRLGSEGWELVQVTPVGDGTVGTARLLYTLKRLRAG